MEQDEKNKNLTDGKKQPEKNKVLFGFWADVWLFF